MATPTTTNWREIRRFRAYELAQQGWTQQHIAQALGVSQSAISQWLTRAQTQGLEALQTRKSPGRPPKWHHENDAELVQLLKQGAEAHGFHGDVWTSARVTTLIAHHFGVTLSDRQVRRLLRALRWSRQQPIRRATQRDEAAIARWARHRWPRLKKTPDAPIAR